VNTIKQFQQLFSISHKNNLTENTNRTLIHRDGLDVTSFEILLILLSPYVTCPLFLGEMVVNLDTSLRHMLGTSTVDVLLLPYRFFFVVLMRFCHET